MKKLFFILAIGMTFFSSCKKCATCTQITTTTTPASNVNPQGTEQITTTTFEACGSDLKAVNGKTTKTETLSPSGNYAIVTVITRTTCN